MEYNHKRNDKNMLTRDQIERIKNNYEIKEDKWLIFCKNGKQTEITPNFRRCVLCFDEIIPKNKKDDIEYLNRLESDGKIIFSTNNELYDVFSKKTEDEICELKYHMSKKCWEYICNYKSKLNFLDIELSDDEIPKEYFISSLKNNHNLYKVDNKYILQVYWTNHVDDYGFTKYVFSAKPNNKAIDSLDAIFFLQDYFKFNGEYFYCYACGRKVSFFELEGSLINRIKRIKCNNCCDDV